MTKCNIIKIPKDCCFIRFCNKKDYKKLYHSSIDDFETIEGENMIIDVDKNHKVIGIELLGSDECKKPCQEDSEEGENLKKLIRKTKKESGFKIDEHLQMNDNPRALIEEE